MSGGYDKKSVKAKYGGYIYDSLTEVSWAVFFDHAGMKYIPHPAWCKEFHTGRYWQNGTEIFYTPDFYLQELNLYCEVKNTDEQIRNINFQKKASAAMTDYATPISHGLVVLGAMTGFDPGERKGAQAVCLGGDYYKWNGSWIAKGYWRLGDSDESGLAMLCNLSDVNDHPAFPFLSNNSSALLWHSYTHARSSRIVWDALRTAMYAKDNGLFEIVQEENHVKKISTIDLIPWD